jgi:lipoprotein LpqS
MTLVSADRPLRWRSAIAVAAVAWVLTAVLHCGPARSESDTPHLPHPLLTSLGSEFAINVDHPHLVDTPAQCHHEQFATAALPRAATALVALGVVVAVLAVTGSSAQPVVITGRGPPSAAGNFFTGQDLLTRFCLARR